MSDDYNTVNQDIFDENKDSKYNIPPTQNKSGKINESSNAKLCRKKCIILFTDNSQYVKNDKLFYRKNSLNVTFV